METFKLPASNFEWVDEKKVKSWTKKDIMNFPTQTDTGYAFEVDLVYPKKYHRVRKTSYILNEEKKGKIVYLPLSILFSREMISSHWLRTTVS